MRNYLVASLMYEAKFKAIGAFDPSSNIMVVLELERIDRNGMFDRGKLLKEIQLAREDGFQTLVETRDKTFIKHTPIIALSDRSEDSRLCQDVYFEHLESMMLSRLIDVGKENQDRIATRIKQVRKTINQTTGRIVYEFKNLGKDELPTLMLLVSLHVDPPRGVNFALGIEQAMRAAPIPKSKVERMKYAVGLRVDEENDAYWEKRIEETQKKFQ